MFDSLSERLSRTLKQVSGNSKLTEDNIKDSLREVRMALLEADVALPVVKSFVGKIKEKVIGQKVHESLKPGQAFVKLVHAELVAIMGNENDALDLTCQPPAVVLVAGLQGAGKTTTVAKLAKWLKGQKKSVMVVSTDVYRPAAIEQLKTLADEVEVDCFPSHPDQSPRTIAKSALNEARLRQKDVLLVDTAGRLHIDEKMMTEIQHLNTDIKPVETLFVIDAMTGQDAVNTAKAFNKALPLTGIVLTKADGDSRGGVALSVREITGKSIKFLGVGEKTDALEPFHPDRMASRILGMGDVLSLIEEAERSLDKKKADKLVKKLKKGQYFDLEDFREQLLQMKNMGGIGKMMDKLPGMGDMQMPPMQMQGKVFGQMEAIINSMTITERRKPEIINGSRKKRIAKGSGTQVPDVNRLIKQHKQMSKMMKKMTKKGGLARMMRGMPGGLRSGMSGKMLPPGMKGL